MYTYWSKNSKRLMATLLEKAEQQDRWHAEHKDDWQCEVCSHMNDPRNKICDICHNSKETK